MKLTKHTKNILAVFTFGICIKIMSLLYKIVTTRMLTLEGMRLISLIAPILSLCLVLSSFQTPLVTNQHIASNIKTNKTKVSIILLSSLKITLLSSSIISIVLLLSFPLYKIVYQTSTIYLPLLICIPLIYLANISGLMKSYLEAFNKFYLTYFVNTIEMLLKIILIVVLLLIFKDSSIETKVLLTFISLLLSELSSTIIFSLVLKKHINKEKILQKTDKYEYKIIKQAIPLTIDSLVSSLGAYITPFIYYFACKKINISSYTATTYYALVSAYAIPLLICGQFPVMSIAKMMFPTFTKSSNLECKKLLEKTLVLALPTSVFILILCQIYPKEVLNLLYNDISSYEIVIYLAPIYFFLYFNPLFTSLLQAKKQEKKLLYLTIFSQVLNIILVYIFTTMLIFNTSGYMIAISISNLIRFILLIVLTKKTINYKIINKSFIFYLLAIVYYIINYFNQNIMFYFMSTLFFSLLYLLIFYFYNKRITHYHTH